MGGLSARSLLAMKIFAREFPDGPIAQQPVAQLPWGQLTDSLPEELRSSLPTIEEIEAELANDIAPAGPSAGGKSQETPRAVTRRRAAGRNGQ